MEFAASGAAALEAVRRRHNPSASPVMQLSPLVAVHVADYIHAALEPCQTFSCGALDKDFLARCDLMERVERWTGACTAGVGENQ